MLFDLTNFTGDIKMLTKIIYYFSIMCDELYIKTEYQDHFSFINNEFEGQVFVINSKIMDAMTDQDTKLFKDVYNFTNINTEEDIYRAVNVPKQSVDMYV
jgi:hypothetical protein